MSTYGTMQSRIASDLNRTDLTTNIRSAIQDAISFYSGTRFWFNEARASTAESFGPTVNGTEWYDLPSDFQALDTLSATVSNDTYPLTQIDYEQSEALQMPSGLYKGRPWRFAIYRQQIRMVPVPDGAYPLTLSYVKSLAALSADADTNAWMVAGEQLIRERATAIVRISKLRNDGARMEANMLQQQGSNCLSVLEQSALRNLSGRTASRVGTGRLTATSF